MWSKERAAYAGLLAMIIAACGASDSAPQVSPTREVLVSAAASLSDAFSEMESIFEAHHPEVDVVLNLGGSSSLRQQILEGAPAGVFASANLANMDRLVDAREVSGERRIFARNRLQIAVPRGNPAKVKSLRDFGDPDLLIGLCAEDVPCGDFARQALHAARVVPAADTNEPNARALLTKVELAELDAAITYATDVASAGGRVDGVDFPGSENLEVAYPIAILAGAPDPGAAEAFVRFVLSNEGQAVLRRHGFEAP